jgi:ABC-2 type transport system permease protein
MIKDLSHDKIKKQKRHFYLKSSIKAILIIGLVVFATLIAYKIPWIYDMTAGKVFTLSDQTKQTVKSLTVPVEIIAVYPTGGSEPMVTSLLAEYSKIGSQLSVDYVDAEREPQKLNKYNLGSLAVSNGTIIVSSSGKSKILFNSDLFQAASDGDAFWGERQITGAIRYVTASVMENIYFVEGHDEASTTSILSQAKTALELDSYNVQTLSLVKSGTVPQDASILIFPSPKKDLSESELISLEDYLLKGGKAIFLVDAMSTNTMVLENFNKLLHEFGIDITNNLVVEEDANSHVSNNNLYLIPGYSFHFITQKLAESKQYVILPIAMGLHTLDFNKDEIKLELLLASTPRSWMRTDMTIASTAKISEDIQGPIPLAYASTRIGSGYGSGDSRIVVIGNSTFITNSNLETYANRDFFLKSIGWLAGDRESDSISPRIIGADKLIVRGNDFVKLVVIVLVVMPLIPFSSALAIWYLRRNR